MGDGNKRGNVKAGESLGECDVRLGLRMQRSESFPSKRMMAMPHLPPPTRHHHYHHHQNDNNNSSSSTCYSVRMTSSTTAVGYGGGDVGGPIYCNLSNNQLEGVSDLYDVVGAAGSGSGSDSSLKASGGGGMPKPKVPFTVSQWEELERQTTVYKYMMASIPVPPHLLLSFPKIPSPVLTNSQSNSTCELDLRYTKSNTDAEPWRCRRTDGKKWRCSRDVAPYQKYCERHAHKPRPRSRKPVEQQIQPHITTTTASTTTNSKTHPLVNLPFVDNSTGYAFQRSVFHIPAMVSGATYAQPRCTEWFMKGDPVPGSTLDEQWQQMVQPSPREGLKLYGNHDRTVSFLQNHYGEEQESMNRNTYINMTDGQGFLRQHSLQGTLDTDHQAQPTRHFIDAWSSCAEGGEMGEISNKTSVLSSSKLPLSSLTLSMSAGNEIDEENGDPQMGIGMMMVDPEVESGRGFKSEWFNPGGPLGEALCLGISSGTKSVSNLPSPRGYSNSATTSSCSKSSCEDNSHGLHFH